MGRRRVISLLSAAVLCGLLLPALARAQAPRIPERCQPQPKKEPETKLSIDGLQLEGPGLPLSVSQAQFVAMLEQRAGSGDGGWLDRVWNAAREEWRDRGYFQTVVNVRPIEDSLQAGVRHVSLRIRVDPGPRYRIEEVRILNVNPGGKLVFSRQRLRHLIPVGPGDLVNVEKARQGVEAIEHLYASHGYIDFQATPDFQIDGQQDRISLFVMLDQGRQYRVGKIEALGFGHTGLAILHSKIKSGDIFDWNVVKRFYSRYQWLMPVRASVSDDRVSKNEETDTVDLLLDFRACPKPAVAGSPAESAGRNQTVARPSKRPRTAEPFD